MAVLAALTLTIGLGLSTASAQTYPVVATLSIDRSTTQACTTVTLTGTNFLPNTSVTITANGQSIGTATTDANGNFTFVYQIPQGTQPGTITFNATDGTNNLTSTLTITPGGCGTTSTTSSSSNSGNAGSTSGNAGAGSTGSSGSTSGSLASTGAAVQWMVRLAILLVAAGGLLLLALRGRDGKASSTA